MKKAPQVRFELTTYRLTADCSTIELLRNKGQRFCCLRLLLYKISKPL